MTCIVGIADGTNVWLGGDSASSNAYFSLGLVVEPKVFSVGEFVMRYTTSFRMGQVLRHKFKPPLREPSADVMAYMVAEFVDAVRDALKAAGFARKDHETEAGGVFLIGYQGRLFRMQEEYSLIELTAGYDACGCAEDIARGSLYATRDKPVQQRIDTALRAAEFHSAGVSSPFHTVQTPSVVRAAA